MAERTLLPGTLREREKEIGDAILRRVREIDGSAPVADPTYTAGLEHTVRVAVAYALEVLERGAESMAPAPPAIRAQAALAARNKVGLEVVLRRYGAGYTLLGEFIIGEAQTLGIGGAPLRRAMRDNAATFDRLVATVTQAYADELRHWPVSAAGRRLDTVRRLLAGESLDGSGLGYDLRGHHLALAFAGPGSAEAARAAVAILGGGFGRLLVEVDDESAWLWLGSVQPFPRTAVGTLVEAFAEATVAAGVGEPASGVDGWRLGHRQATAALTVAQRGGGGFVPYRDAMLLAAALSDDLLATSLRELYLEPLERGRDRGGPVRDALRTYFACERNVAATAAALAVTRNTVSARLAAAERSLGRSLNSCAASVELALQLQSLEDDR